jgi:glycine cleavage system H protein
MEEFSYHNIFATKGIEYIAIIAFLALLIPFWVQLNRQSKARDLKKAMGILSARILRIPQGLFFSKNHTWTFMEKSGSAKVGLDDLLLHITGEVTFRKLKNPGDLIKKGELLTEIDQKGKFLQVFSPISGKILAANESLNENPDMMVTDPYGIGWIYKIKPSAWMAETGSYLIAEEATSWSHRELQRFRDFLAVSVKKLTPEPSLLVLQDGGELRDNTLSEMPDEIWKDFQESFLKLPAEK